MLAMSQKVFLRAPFLGVEAKEWEKLVAKGRESGEVHAEDVTHVLRHVELTGDVLVDVQSKMAEHGIDDR